MQKLSIDGVGKKFGALEALRDLDIEVGAGEFVCVVGPSGCGKSTLMRIIAGLETPTQGSVTVGSQRVTGPGPDRGFVFQADSLLPWNFTPQPQPDAVIACA